MFGLAELNVYQIHTFVIENMHAYKYTITETISISLKGSNTVANINDVNNNREWKLNV